MPFKFWSFVFVSLFALVVKGSWPSGLEAQAFEYHGKFGESFRVADFLSEDGTNLIQEAGSGLNLALQDFRHLAIHPSGRYVFLAGANSSSFFVLDVLSGKRFFQQSSLGFVRGLFWSEQNNRLVVATTRELAFYRLNSAFDLEKMSDFEIVEDSSRPKELLASCQINDNRYALLEIGDDLIDTRLRVIQGSSEVGGSPVFWEAIVGSGQAEDFLPIGLLCNEERVLILAEDEREDTKGEIVLYLRNSTSLAQASSPLFLGSSYEDFDLRNIIRSVRGTSFLLNFERRADVTTGPISRVVELNFSNFSVARTRSFDSDRILMLGSIEESNSIRSLLFRQDPDNGSAPIELYSVADTALATADLENPSASFSLSPNRLMPRWVGVSGGYAYALMDATGLGRFSRGSVLNLTEFSYEPPWIRFRAQVDRPAVVDLRFQEESLEGGFTTPSDSWGSSFLMRNLSPDSSEADQVFEISTSSLGVKLNRRHELVVFARENPGGVVSGREAVSFVFDPPPKPVINFRTGFGDQSFSVFFQVQEAPGDLSHFYLHLSESEEDLASLPSSEDEVPAFEREIVLQDGSRIQSPVRIDFKFWTGSIRFSPAFNSQTYYARVQVVDESLQFSSDDPPALGATPLKTRSLEQAFGGTNSCRLMATSLTGGSIFSFLVFFWALIGLRTAGFRQKKWAQRLRNRRGGD
ncbi:MAG: hypothetical protein EA369_07950 [Bradymonadales bacterium]|nr:MAG: hypothetical protein EA369_07950 [Bradymonadales bacterium]